MEFRRVLFRSHSNIMTIHRMLGFYPEFYDAVDPDSGEIRQTMRFVPSYNKENLLPWDIIVVDEAGMCGLDLWHLIWAACKPTTRIFIVGDFQPQGRPTVREIGSP